MYDFAYNPDFKLFSGFQIHRLPTNAPKGIL
jgi:hypothetical protein